ncbi:MAG: CoB--CoM heterodisulfide reductase iron-sulfur subunit B family protein [Candidatus Helarchaeota archaeon]
MSRKMIQLFLGCVIPARLPFIESSARKVFDKLGLAISHLENASCCPDPTGIPAIDHGTWLALGARNLSLCEDNGSSLISLCSGCVETLKMVNHILKHDEKKKTEVNALLAKIGKEYRGTVEIKHAARLLHENLDKIKEKVVIPLKNLKVACHYGCHYLRPSEIIEWDDPFTPTSLDDLVTAVGATSINYRLKMDCCGSPLSKTDEELSNQILLQKLKNMEEAGANCITVVCPACFQQFDFGQKNINKIYGTSFSFPVFYFTELMALAMGLDEKTLGFKYHGIKVNNLLLEIENSLEVPQT